MRMQTETLILLFNPHIKCSRKSNKTPDEANAPTCRRATFPTCSPRLLRMLDSSMLERQSTRSIAVSTSLVATYTALHCLLQRTGNPTGMLHLIRAAAKDLHQNLSDWKGPVS